MAEPSEPATTDGPRRRPHLSRRALLLIVGPIVVLAVVGTATTALTPALAARHPLLLILLESRNRNLLLARRVDLVPFLVVATFRRVLTDPLYYVLGRAYGEEAVRWLEVKAGFGRFARVIERAFERASYPAVFLFPGAVVCTLAGVVDMPVAVFLGLNVAGTIAAVIVIRIFGDVFAGPIDAVLGFFNHHLVATTAASIGLVMAFVLVGRALGRSDLKIRDIADLGQPPTARSDVDEGVEADGDAGPGGD